MKLVFRFDPPAENGFDGERMWVEVHRTENGGYVGSLLNEPDYIEILHPGDEIRFRPEHVASMHYEDGELGYDIDSHALVSARVRDGDPAWNVTRLPPEDRSSETDSGWQISSRRDDDAYLADPDNCLWLDLGWLTDRYPGLEKLFKADPQQGDWEWDPVSADFVTR